MAAIKTGKTVDTVTREDVEQYYLTTDSHKCIEGHLPSLVPLGFVEKIYIPSTTYDQLTQPEKDNLALVFKEKKNWLHLVPTNVSPELVKNCVYKTTSVKTGFCITLEAKFGKDAVLPCPFKSDASGKVKFSGTGSKGNTSDLCCNLC
jgi:hypothetical protein